MEVANATGYHILVHISATQQQQLQNSQIGAAGTQVSLDAGQSPPAPLPSLKHQLRGSDKFAYVTARKVQNRNWMFAVNVPVDRGKRLTLNDTRGWPADPALPHPNPGPSATHP